MAARKAGLRAVGADEKAPVKPVTITAAADGDRRGYLVAMRARISTALDDPNTLPRDLAALMRRASEIDKEIRALDVAAAEEDESGVTEDEGWDASAI